MEAKQVKVLNEDELKVKWNSFSEAYSTMIEHKTVEVAGEFLVTLDNHRKSANLQNTNLDYLELACGSGLFALHILEKKREQLSSALLVDLSDTMIQKTNKNLQEQADSLKLHLNGSAECPETHVSVKVRLANVEKIDFVPDSSKDILISNLVLHLVENPLNLLDQAYRTLKKNSVAYFSVLAEYQDSTIFNAVPEMLKKYGWKGNNTRSIHHLGTEEKLTAIIPSDKFEVLGTQLVKSVYDKSDENLIDFMFSLGMHSEFIDSLPENERVKLRNEHQQLIKDLKQGNKEVVYYIRAVFVKKK